MSAFITFKTNVSSEPSFFKSVHITKTKNHLDKAVSYFDNPAVF